MDQNFPKVSVVIPAYNRPLLLQRAIQSVLNQSYRNIEIIVVDDASTEAIFPTLNTFSQFNIKYAKHPQNKGLAASRNTGSKMAEGEFINFLDDDDELDPSKIEKQMNIFLNSSPNLGLVYCGYRYVFKNKIIIEGKPRHRGHILKYALNDSLTIVTHCALIRKEHLLSIGGFDEQLMSAEDFDFWIRFAKFFEYDYVPETLVTYHLHESGNMTRQLQNRIHVREIIMQKYKNDLIQNKQALSVHLCRLGALYYMAGDRRKSRHYIYQSILVWPFHWKGYVYFLLMILDFLKKGTLEHFGTLNYGGNKCYY